MPERVTRRAFVGAAGATAVAAALPVRLPVRRADAGRTAAVASANGLPAVTGAVELMLAGTDTLDAAVEVGDSPIVGAGQYTDNDVGAAGSTGRGESNIMVCGGFFTVEQMRRGTAPTDACLETLRRAVRMSPPRLLYPDGRPRFNLGFYAVNKRGDFGAASLFPGRYAAHDGRDGTVRDTAHLYERPS